VKYARVNGAWPAELPPITDHEAIELVRRLYRKFMGRSYTGQFKIASGNRNTTPRRGVYYVNPQRVYKWGGHEAGWKDIVHDVSHHVHWRKFPKNKPHSATHASLEREMIRHVVASGWLAGKLKRIEKPAAAPPTAAEVAASKIGALDVRIKRWESKRRRAENALAKLNRQRRRLERQAA
jgi:hypothetical protein